MMGANRPTLEAGLGVMSGAWSSFNPLGSEGSFAQFLAPTALDPIVQIAENKNWFGGPIMPENRGYGLDKPDSERSFKTVGAPSKAIAQWLNKVTGGDAIEEGAVSVSPETLEHYYEFISGGVGRLFLRSYKVGDAVMNGADLDRNDMPFVRVLSGEPDKHFVQRQFYDNLEDIERIQARYEMYRDARDSKRAAALRRDKQSMFRFVGPAKTMRKRIKELRKAGMDEQMDRAMRRFNRRYRELNQ